VELYEIPRGLRRHGTETLCTERQARGDRSRPGSEALSTSAAIARINLFHYGEKLGHSEIAGSGGQAPSSPTPTQP